MFDEKDYEVRVKYEGGIMVSASSESDALKRVKKIFLEETNPEMVIDMEFQLKSFRSKNLLTPWVSTAITLPQPINRN